MSRAGYSEDCDDQGLLACWRGAVKSAIRGRRGQAFLKEMLAALDALPQKRLVANVLEAYTVEEDGPVPIKGGDVCAFGAVGRLRGIEMPVLSDDEDDYSDEVAGAVQSIFGTTDALTREIMWVNDECDRGRKVAIPNVRRGDWDPWGYDWLPERPEERWARVRKWLEKQIIQEEPSEA